LVDVGVLGPLGVHPEFQRMGVGTALIQAVVSASNDRDLPVLFVEGDPHFYQKHGFVPGKSLGFRKPSIRIPDAAFQCMPLDRFSSVLSGTLIYAEPFWDHDCVGLREPDFISWLKSEVLAGREL
jgi:putative acetyltransferase